MKNSNYNLTLTHYRYVRLCDMMQRRMFDMHDAAQLLCGPVYQM